jgi:alkanesulfonate monooxygenase SsuD/methylene tetrahydromethanopterin reductase-like flavin-dependent oxidoreductase (luciferase family)
MVLHGIVLPTRSVVDSEGAGEQLSDRLQSDVVEFARELEARGLDAVWVGDSVTDRPRLEPVSTLSAVAIATDSIDVGTAIYLMHLRHPIHVAHQLATLSQISEGRFKCGIGVGYGSGVRTEHDHLGVPFDQRGSFTNEVLDIVTGLWNDDRLDHDGSFFSFEDVGIGFSPPSQPPFYIASSTVEARASVPSTLADRVADHGHGWLPIGLSADSYESGLEIIRRIVADAGRDPSRLRAAYYQDIVVANSERTALEEARRYLLRYYPSLTEISDEQIRQKGVFGSPEKVARHLERFRKRGVEEFVTRFPVEDQHEQLHWYANIVRQ